MLERAFLPFPQAASPALANHNLNVTTRAPRYAEFGCHHTESECANSRIILVLTPFSTVAMDGPASPLLDLPPELRNRIYYYVFSGNVISIRWFRACVCRYSNTNDSRVFLYTKAEQLRFQALMAPTQVCRQMRSENRLLPYKYSTYDFPGALYGFSKWLQSLDQAAKAVVAAALTEVQRQDLEVCKGTHGIVM